MVQITQSDHQRIFWARLGHIPDKIFDLHVHGNNTRAGMAYARVNHDSSIRAAMLTGRRQNWRFRGDSSTPAGVQTLRKHRLPAAHACSG